MSSLDDIARQVAPQTDQAHAATAALARQIATYYRTLRSQGLGVEAATYLTRDYQSIMLHYGLPRGGGG